jgi:hypothetical protein
MIIDQALRTKLAQMSDRSGECLVWSGWITEGGYGRVYHSGKNHYVHRLAWADSQGQDIPAGMMIDHICRNRACLRPEHLRLVSARTNSVENSVGKTARNVAKTHCVNGHEFTTDNTRLVKRKGTDRRYCRACERARSADYFRRIGKDKRRMVEAGDA